MSRYKTVMELEKGDLTARGKDGYLYILEDPVNYGDIAQTGWPVHAFKSKKPVDLIPQEIEVFPYPRKIGTMLLQQRNPLWESYESSSQTDDDVHSPGPEDMKNREYPAIKI